MNDHSHSAFDLNAPANFVTFFQRLLTEDFMPHGHCYFWRPEILWLHVLSDIAIALAYYSIPAILVYFVIKRRDIPFHWMFLMFGAFIFLCGTTHVVDVITTWLPFYRLEGIIKLLTAIASVATAFFLLPILPRIISMPNLETAIQQLTKKSNELEKINKELDRFNKASLGREERIIELKQEVNKLCKELGRKEPYESVE